MNMNNVFLCKFRIQLAFHFNSHLLLCCCQIKYFFSSFHSSLSRQYEMCQNSHRIAMISHHHLITNYMSYDICFILLDLLASDVLEDGNECFLRCKWHKTVEMNFDNFWLVLQSYNVPGKRHLEITSLLVKSKRLTKYEI